MVRPSAFAGFNSGFRSLQVSKGRPDHEPAVASPVPERRIADPLLSEKRNGRAVGDSVDLVAFRNFSA
jgi:hypothetical protein